MFKINNKTRKLIKKYEGERKVVSLNPEERNVLIAILEREKDKLLNSNDFDLIGQYSPIITSLLRKIKRGRK